MIILPSALVALASATLLPYAVAQNLRHSSGRGSDASGIGAEFIAVSDAVSAPLGRPEPPQVLDGASNLNLPDTATCFTGGDCASRRCEFSSSSSTFRECLPSLEYGEPCNENSDCASGTCFSLCMECETHDDCDAHGFSPPGELPKAFCYTGDPESGNYCSEWKNGHPIGSEGYPVWLGTSDEPPTMMRRQVVEGPPMSLVWHFDLNNQIGGAETTDLFSANSTHVKIPLNTKLLAGYSISNHVQDEYETGILTARLGRNPYSTVSKLPFVGWYEKYHTLTHEGELDHNWVDYVRAELEQRDAATQQEAEDRFDERSRLMVGSSRSIGQTMTEANQDVVHVTEIQDYVRRVNSGELPVEELMEHEEFSGRSNKAVEALVHAKTLSSLKSENHCSHFEEQDNMKTTETHLEFPLNSAVVMLKGMTQFAPSHFISYGGGVVVAKYFADRNALEFRWIAFQQSRLYMEPSPPKPSGLYVSPILGYYPARDVDGRSDQKYDAEGDLSFLKNAAIRRFQSIPVDYSAFDRAPTCSAEVKDKLSPLWQTANRPGPDDNIFDKMKAFGSIIGTTAGGAKCGSTWMKADGYPDLVGYRLLQFAMFAHTITETEAEHREEAAFGTWWDDWDAFYKENAMD